MGWWDKFKALSHTVWNNDLVAQTTSNISSFTYNTILKTVELAPATIKTAASSIFHPPTRQVAYHMLRIFAEDIVPLVTVNYVFNTLNQYSQEHLDEDAGWMSTNTLITSSLLLLQAAVYTYNFRKQTQATVRMAVVTLEAARSLNKVNHDLPKQICLEEKCDSLRFIKGSFRDLTTFWATEAALSLIGYIPYGERIAAVLSVYHHGRYALTMVLPDLCQRHQVEYLNEYAELPLALGIHHAISTGLLSYGIESITSIPTSYYRPFIAQAMLLTQISVAAHSHLPPPVKQTNRGAIDPVGNYQDFIGFIFDTLAAGLKKQIPILLKRPSSNIPWKKLFTMAQQLNQHPYTQILETIVLPRMLHSPEAFIADPVIQPYWHYLRERSIFALKLLEDTSESFLIKVATYNPKKAARLLWLIFGIPKSLANEALNLIGNQDFIIDIGALRQRLEALEVRSSLKEVHSDSTNLELRHAEVLTPIPALLEDDSKLVEAKAIIKPVKNSSLNAVAKNIILTSHQKPFKATNANTIIQSKSSLSLIPSVGLFKATNENREKEQDKQEINKTKLIFS